MEKGNQENQMEMQHVNQGNGEITESFDFDSLKLSQDFTESIGTKKLLTTVPVRKPGKQEWFRVHPSEEYRMPAGILDFKEEREIFLLTSKIQPTVASEMRAVTLHTCISRQRVLFLYPLPLPGPDGRSNSWWDSAAEAVELAKRKWMKMVANMDLGAYEVHEANGELPPPEWPEMDFQEIVKIAFRDKIIDDVDHPALKRLRGEI